MGNEINNSSSNKAYSEFLFTFLIGVLLLVTYVVNLSPSYIFSHINALNDSELKFYDLSNSISYDKYELYLTLPDNSISKEDIQMLIMYLELNEVSKCPKDTCKNKSLFQKEHYYEITKIIEKLFVNSKDTTLFKDIIKNITFKGFTSSNNDLNSINKNLDFVDESSITTEQQTKIMVFSLAPNELNLLLKLRFYFRIMESRIEIIHSLSFLFIIMIIFCLVDSYITRKIKYHHSYIANVFKLKLSEVYFICSIAINLFVLISLNYIEDWFLKIFFMSFLLILSSCYMVIINLPSYNSKNNYL